MNIEQALERTMRWILTEQRFAEYKRTQQVAAYAYAIQTGEKQEKYVTHFRARETEAEKRQRLELTNSYTPFAANQIINYFKKIRRTDGVTRRIAYPNDEQAERDLNQRVAMFYDDESLEQYLHDVVEHFTFYDPNAWLLFERQNIVDGENRLVDVVTYPVEIPSHQIVDFSMERARLEFLMFEQTEFAGMDEHGQPRSVRSVYLYGAGYVLHTIESGSTRDDARIDDGYQPLVVAMRDGTESKWLQRVVNNGTTETPAIRLSAFLDGQTKLRTGVTPLEPAKQLFDDLIRDKSFHDLTVTLHTFPQKYVYAERCMYHDAEGVECDHGWIGNNKCPSCGGTGYDTHATEQESVVLSMPDDPSQMFDLNRLATYISLPEWLPQWQREQLLDTVKKIGLAVFNTEVYTLSQVAQTATEKLLQYENIYDALTPYANLISRAWRLGVRVHGMYLEMAMDELDVAHQFPVDFRMQSLDELLAQYATARNANASQWVLDTIENNILAKQHRDDPTFVATVHAFRRWLPFTDKTESQIAAIISNRAVTDPDRVLWENSARIFNEILWMTDGVFAQLSIEGQRRVVQLATQQHIENIAPVATAPPALTVESFATNDIV